MTSVESSRESHLSDADEQSGPIFGGIRHVTTSQVTIYPSSWDAGRRKDGWHIFASGGALLWSTLATCRAVAWAIAAESSGIAASGGRHADHCTRTTRSTRGLRSRLRSYECSSWVMGHHVIMHGSCRVVMSHVPCESSEPGTCFQGRRYTGPESGRQARLFAKRLSDFMTIGPHSSSK